MKYLIKLINFLKKYGWCRYMGAALPAFTGIGFMNWEFHAIIIPIILLNGLNSYHSFISVYEIGLDDGIKMAQTAQKIKEDNQL